MLESRLARNTDIIIGIIMSGITIITTITTDVKKGPPIFILIGGLFVNF
jgi:hypothetical protein